MHVLFVRHISIYLQSYDYTFQYMMCLSAYLDNYTDLAAHTVTFCKSTILLPQCEYCGQKLDACNCIKLQKLVFSVICKFVKNQSENNIFTSDFFSTVFHSLVSISGLQGPLIIVVDQNMMRTYGLGSKARLRILEL